ncbi:unnamed protein product [[Candida] boidinii]|nr:unnamed protein product [[Candida] boidinii]
MDGLRTRISELELVNDLYRTRIMELEALEQAARQRESLLKKRLDDLRALPASISSSSSYMNSPVSSAASLLSHHIPFQQHQSQHQSPQQKQAGSPQQPNTQIKRENSDSFEEVSKRLKVEN